PGPALTGDGLGPRLAMTLTIEQWAPSFAPLLMNGKPSGERMSTKLIDKLHAAGVVKMLQPLPNVDAVAGGVSEHEAAQAVIGVANALDDVYAVRDQVVVELDRIRHEQVCHVAIGRTMRLRHREMKLGAVDLQDHEPDRAPVLERLGEAEDV